MNDRHRTDRTSSHHMPNTVGVVTVDDGTREIIGELWNHLHRQILKIHAMPPPTEVWCWKLKLKTHSDNIILAWGFQKR